MQVTKITQMILVTKVARAKKLIQGIAQLENVHFEKEETEPVSNIEATKVTQASHATTK